MILPLTIKQIRSMQRLQQYAPELKALQQKYKNDKQRMNEEVMKFYREHKVNPAASCLPILPQIPIFISLFYVLRDFEKEVFPRFPSSELGFLNGVVPDITQHVNEHWSGWLLLVRLRHQPAPRRLLLSTTTCSRRRQRYVLLALPFVFIPFIINFPVGLMIYWVTTNLWTVGQGLVTRRLYPRPVLEPPKKSSRTPAKEPRRRASGAKPKATPAPTFPKQHRRRRRRRRSAETGQAAQEEGPAHPAMSETRHTREQGETIGDREAEASRGDRRRGEMDGAAGARAPLPRARQVPG